LKSPTTPRLEGRSTRLDPNQIVDAAGILRRNSLRAGSIRERADPIRPIPTLPAETDRGARGFEAAFAPI